MALQDFQILARLGSGVFSCVYKAKRILDDKFYAIKKVKLSNLTPKEKQNALNQAIILAAMNHPNIIGYHEAILESESQYLCIVMEYAQQGDLLQKILKKKEKKENFEENFIWKVMISVLNGLKKLHAKKIIHRDLKSANVFIGQKDSIKIGDLNVSKVTHEGLCFTQTGTPYYASPQIWKDQPYGTKSDIWSLGCVIYEMACLKPPFGGNDMQQLYKTVTKGIYSRIPSIYSTDLNDVLRMMLQIDPLVRPSAQKLLNSSIIKKKLRETPELQSLILEQDNENDNPQILTQKNLRRKNLRDLSVHLPEANYNRTRVKTLHEPRQMQIKVNKSDIYNRGTYRYDYSPSSRIKKSNYQVRTKEDSSSRISSKKSNYKILSKRNNVVELARKQIMNLGIEKLKSIKQKIDKQPPVNKSIQQLYMKKMMIQRTKTDTDALIKNISMLKANPSENKVKMTIQ